MDPIKPIKTERQYRRALKEIEGLMAARSNTPEGDRLDVLVTLVQAWEAKHYPLDLRDRVEAIRYHMESRGLAPSALTWAVDDRSLSSASPDERSGRKVGARRSGVFPAVPGVKTSALRAIALRGRRA